MLKIANISSCQYHSDEWYRARLAKLTASRISCIMDDKWLTAGAVSYLHEKVGEEMTGVAARDEVDTAATRWGLLYEPEALKIVGAHLKVDFMVTQKVVTEPGSRFACTPDGLIVRSKSKDKKHYDVSTVEVKCPPTYNNYIKLFLCKTPADLKNANKVYFWQVVDQMLNCDCLKGYFGVYHPLFKSGNYNVIEFNKINLIPEFRLLQQRKEMAEKEFCEIRSKLLGA